MESSLRLASGMSARTKLTRICKTPGTRKQLLKNVNRLPEVVTHTEAHIQILHKGFPQKFISTCIQDAKKKKRCPNTQGTYSQDEELGSLSGCTELQLGRPGHPTPASPVPDRHHTHRGNLKKSTTRARNATQTSLSNTKRKTVPHRGR